MQTKDKLILLLLAINIDGITDEEKGLLREIAKQYAVSEKNMLKVKSEVNSLLGSGEPVGEIFKICIQEAMERSYDKMDNMQFLWTLVNMGFIDGDYSDNERSLVNLYCEFARLDKIFAREFEDIAKAMVAVVEQKKFLQNSKINSQKSEILSKELDKNQAVLKNNISELISLSSTLE
ncbi:hypothetical protein OFO03_03850 [Campylobacter sp. JMF_02 ED1]|uniref:hypothetical protein n=1 Tax=unclassified Campylobacter TaxID=2593542 RepID=UPI0022EA039A|nr:MULTISPECIES: hypothetical protein [unclassified Campylobacter]MDA3049545.1 hypothetical protein [Campylobacter sp. JMF_15 NE4]MDA3051028.1 hypothetical protein [Campylobacter sp. JMF_02 ED1]